MPAAIDSWARIISSIEQIPALFQEATPSTATFPYTIYTPEDRWGNAKLISLYDDKIVIAEKQKKSGVVKTSFPFSDVNYLEHGRILLYSWVSIHGLVGGQPAACFVPYNTVVENLFAPVIEMLRGANARQVCPANPARLWNKSAWEDLRKVNFKFSSYILNTVPIDTIVRAVYQQALTEKRFGLLTRTAIPAQMMFMTDKELVLFQDDGDGKKDRDGRLSGAYGVIRSYIPYGKICKASVDNVARESWLTFRIKLPGEEVRLRFNRTRRSELDVFAAELEDVRSQCQ